MGPVSTWIYVYFKQQTAPSGLFHVVSRWPASKIGPGQYFKNRINILWSGPWKIKETQKVATRNNGRHQFVNRAANYWPPSQFIWISESRVANVLKQLSGNFWTIFWSSPSFPKSNSEFGPGKKINLNPFLWIDRSFFSGTILPSHWPWSSTWRTSWFSIPALSHLNVNYLLL